MFTEVSVSDLWFSYAAECAEGDLRKRAENFMEYMAKIQELVAILPQGSFSKLTNKQFAEACLQSMALNRLFVSFISFNDDDGSSASELTESFLRCLDHIFVTPDSELNFDAEWLVIEYHNRV